ncbi:YNG1-like protein [Mya arenaria]|uniref:YNG1-like protein n=1 Tax=Mya arenaria TaxID=6604 RepID=A0ABY7GBZ8_MYAAR|nr:YNG1-like protein [Mya arenaria]
MNAVQMWRAGCKRSTHVFGRPDAMLAQHHEIVASSDVETVASEPETDPPDEDWEDVAEEDEELMSEELEDEHEGNELDETIMYGFDECPPGYTLCWDNVGRQVKARHQTRNHGNKYQTWALAYAVKNRIYTTNLDDKAVLRAENIAGDVYLLNSVEHRQIRDRMINMVSRIIKNCIPSAQNANIDEHIWHHFEEESKKKRNDVFTYPQMFNIGILEENPSSIPGVVNILEKLQEYVPTDGAIVHKLICWGDGLSCERHVDAQNSRANADNPLLRLEGLEPSAQEFHKRMLLMQDTMDTYFNPKSGMDKGTLYHLKNLFNHRSVTHNVSESFNYVSEFLRFVTEGYITAFALDELQMDDLDEEVETNTENVQRVSEVIVDKIWNPTRIVDGEGTCTNVYCFCKQEECISYVTGTSLSNVNIHASLDVEDDDSPMIECEGDQCPNGKWFHFECVGIDENEVPEGSWFCSKTCKSDSSSLCRCKKRKDEAMVECSYSLCANGLWFHASCVDESWYCSNECKGSDKMKKSTTENDLKYRYTQGLVWAGINDLIRRDAVRHNDGHMMVLYWKADLVNFFTKNHPKTVNIRGGMACNDEADLVNEFLNREFKESIRGLGSKATSDTLSRHGKLAGGVAKELQKMYASLYVDDPKIHIKTRRETKREDDMDVLVKLIRKEQLTRQLDIRCHKAFPKLDNKTISKVKFESKMASLSKRLDLSRDVRMRQATNDDDDDDDDVRDDDDD